MAEPLVRSRARVQGVVQGVGFRPFVYNLALGLGLTGRVANTAAGVELAVQGPAPAVDAFFARLAAEPPPLARINDIERGEAPPRDGEDGFVILESAAGTRRTLISPDVSVCEQCLAEMRDPENRRYRYPFINCTHCGPRYTIIKDLPYDRPQTTMAGFTMCPDCLAEYRDPTDRRFHAQPNACPVCGPRLWLAGPDGEEVQCADPVAKAAEALRAGKVVAIKGLGGFHLACDPFNPAAVDALRGRKHREEKPLALMVPDLTAARALVALDEASAEALASRERPIVLCPMRADAPVAPGVNPNNRLLGLMLPYTPLHHLLMDEGFAALVMTSGNVSEEPICIGNDDAVCRLGQPASRGAIADLFLLHDRDIYLRGDDSVVRVLGGALRQMRRSRGFAPAPLILPEGLAPEDCPPVLAVGGHLKNTLCLLRGREAFLSQHVGDLENLETLEFFELTAGHLTRIMEAEPAIIAADLHPDYLSTRWALERGLPLARVQHHHAHAAAVMAEHGLSGPALALSLDGTGFGPDGTIWGGEMLLARLFGYRRLGRLLPFALPGGEAAVRQVWRSGLSLLLLAFGPEAADLPLPLLERHGQHLPLMAGMIDTGTNAPLTSSLGRLFDGAAAVCGLRFDTAYEGQAAIELEQAQEQAGEVGYGFDLCEADGLRVLDWRPALRALAKDVAAGAAPGVAARRFHAGLLEGLAAWARLGAEDAGVTDVCLGGGCLQNATLLEGLPPRLEAAGFKVYTPALAPAGDGGLALGQALAAAAAWGRGLLGPGETVLGDGDDMGEREDGHEAR